MKLPLYPEPPQSPIDQSLRQNIDHHCKLCTRGGKARSTCIAPDGQPGGILVVGEQPAQADDETNRPMVSAVGRFIRGLVQNYWNGPVVYDTAIKCRGEREEDTQVTQINACRGFLAATLDECTPTKVLAFGSSAHLSLLGREPPGSSVQGGYGWVNVLGKPTPVYLFPGALGAYRNKFLRAKLDEDIRRVLTEPNPTFNGNGTYTLVGDENLHQVTEELASETHLSFDVETAGQMHNRDFTVLCASLGSSKRNHSWVWGQDDLRASDTRKVLQDVFDRCTISGANIKFDLRAASLLGLRLPEKIEDIQTWRRILEPEARVALDIMSELVGMGGHKAEMEEELVRGIKTAEKSYKDASKFQHQKVLAGFGFPEMLGPVKRGIAEGHEKRSWAFGTANPTILKRYNARDAVATAHLRDLVHRQLDSDAPAKLVWEEIMRPAIRTAVRIENNGINCDRMALMAWSNSLGAEQRHLAQHFVCEGFNPSSNQQVAKHLFEHKKLPIIKTTPGGDPSVDDDVLQALANRAPIVQYLIQWRSLAKLRGTYGDGGGVEVSGSAIADRAGSGGMLQWIRDDGRIHGSIKLSGTRTGRLSMEEPNLQNIPSPTTKAGVMARGIMTAPYNHLLAQLDFGQMELRVAAMLSGDPDMAAVFKSGIDYHLRTAQLISQAAWGIAPSAVTPEHRKFAKVINFGLVYGKGDEALAAEIGCSLMDAATIRKAILGAFPKLASWLKTQVIEAQRTGFSWTYWNGQKARRRPLFDIASDDSMKAGNARRAAANTPIQGLASDYCLVALCRLNAWLEANNHPAKIVATVHDSILIESPNEHLFEAIHMAKYFMHNFDTPIPFEVDIETGKTWGSMEKLVASNPNPF